MAITLFIGRQAGRQAISRTTGRETEGFRIIVCNYYMLWEEAAHKALDKGSLA